MIRCVSISSSLAIANKRQSATHDAIKELNELLELQQKSNRYTHILLNKLQLSYDSPGTDLGSFIDYYIGIASKKSKLMVDKICALDALWMQDLLRVWSDISSRRFIY